MLTMNSAPRVPLLYISKSSFNHFGPLPSDWQKYQPQEILEGPFFPFFITKPPSSCGFRNLGVETGAKAFVQDGPHLPSCSLGSKMLRVNPGPC